MGDLFFDLETQKSIQEVGGRENFKLLRVSVAVTLSAATNEFKTYTEKEVPALIADLKAASRVIGFNLKNFDYQVLKAYTTERLNDLPTLDLLEDIYNKLGFRVGLDALAKRNAWHKQIGGRLASDSMVPRRQNRRTDGLLPRRCCHHPKIIRVRTREQHFWLLSTSIIANKK